MVLLAHLALVAEALSSAEGRQSELRFCLHIAQLGGWGACRERIRVERRRGEGPLTSQPTPIPMSVCPLRMAPATSMTACRPEEHARWVTFTGTESGMPASNWATRA